MSYEHNKQRTTGVFGGGTGGSCCIGNNRTVSHPRNCQNECPYGRGRDFCFPCYKKLMGELQQQREQRRAA